MSEIQSLTPAELDEIAYFGRDKFFMREMQSGTALTYDDVSLATNQSEILPKDANVSTKLHNLFLPTPIISADMDTVTESKMAIAMAQGGGMGIIHYNMTPEAQVNEVSKVKNYVHGVINRPITVTPDQSIGEIIQMRKDNDITFGTFPVLDDYDKLIGLIPSSVLQNMHAERSVRDAMIPRQELITMSIEELGKNPIDHAKEFFRKNMGKNKLLIVDKDNTLKGLITLSDIERISEETGNSTTAQDDEHRLLVGAALPLWRLSDGTLDEDKLADHADELVDVGVDALAISSAHAHTKSIGEVISFIRQRYQSITIIAGNVTSAGGVEFLAKAGANVIKVGQGPGSICTTRIVAGVGIPQISAVYITSKAAERCGVQIIADGGITKSGDIVKAFSAGAHAVMLGGLLGSSDEAPGKIIEIEGRFFKEYRGMGSEAAMKEGSAARYGHSTKDVGKKATAEGISAMKPSSGPVANTLNQLTGGVKSGMGYLGAETLPEMREKARFVKITTAGAVESRPHDVIELKGR